METGVHSIVTTLASNVLISTLVVVYLLTKKHQKGTGAPYQHLTTTKTLSQLFSAGESELSSIGGQDALFYLSFLKLLGYLLLIFSIIGLLGLLPIYTAQMIPASTSLARFSIESMKSEDSSLIIPGICSLLFSLGLIFAAYMYNNISIQFSTYVPRYEDLHEDFARRCTIEVSGIPTNFSPDYLNEILKEYFELYSPDNIVSVNVVPELGKLERLIEDRLVLEEMIRNYSLGMCGKGLEFYIEEKAALDFRIKSYQSQSIESNAGFAYVLCSQPHIAEFIIKSFETKDYMDLDMSTWTLSSAPYLNDIIWKHPPSNKVLSLLSKIVLNFLFVIMFLIILTPLTLVGIISDFVKALEFDSEFTSFIKFSLPSIMISCFHSIIIPLVIKFLTNQEKNHLHSKTYSSAFTKYIVYTLLIIIVFPLLEVVTLANVVQKLAETDVTEWQLRMVANIALVGEFFVSFLISMAIGANFMDLAITNQYFTFDFYIYRNVSESSSAPVFDFTYEYCKVLTVLCVVLVFSIAVPLILPFGCLYMGTKYWFDKYNLMYVYKVESTTGRNLQGLVLVSLLVVLAVGQTVNSGIFLASGSKLLVYFGAFLGSVGALTSIYSVYLHYTWDPTFPPSPHEVTTKDAYIHPFLYYFKQH